MEIKFTIPGPPKGKQRPRICKVNGRTIAYTPKQTIEYERLVMARCVAATEALCALDKSRSNRSALDKSSFTRKGLNASEGTQCLDMLISRNGSGSDPLERSLPLEISILVLEVRILEARCWWQNTKICESFVSIFAKRLQYI